MTYAVRLQIRARDGLRLFQCVFLSAGACPLCSCGEGEHFTSRRDPIKVIGPRPHHPPSLIEILDPIIGPANFVLLGMCKLALDRISTPTALLIEQH